MENLPMQNRRSADCSRGQAGFTILRPCIPMEGETERKIERHRWMRGGKGFRTLEWYTGLSECIEKEFSGQEGAERLSESSILLECMSNLVANESIWSRGGKDD